jgi:uncharacterized delta-60 repeat protein
MVAARSELPARSSSSSHWRGMEALESRCLLASGDLEPVFGSGGTVELENVLPSVGQAEFNDISIQLDGGIIAVGSSSVGFLVARFLPNGTPDPAFGSQGAVQVAFDDGLGNPEPSFPIGALTSLIQPDGKILVGGRGVGTDGSGNPTAAQGLALIRLTPQGDLDTSFGDGGRVLYLPMGADPSQHFEIRQLALRPDNRIIATGSHGYTSGTRFTQDIPILTQFTADGAVDPSFNGGSSIHPPAYVYSIALDSLQRIVLGGTFIEVVDPSPFDSSEFAVARYLSDGTVDTSFGLEGVVKTDLFPPHQEGDSIIYGSDDFGNSVVVQADNKILLGGSVRRKDAPTSDFALVRYLESGQLDATFGSNGIVTTDLGLDDAIDEVSIAVGGRIYASGSSSTIQNDQKSSHLAIARYRVNGALDKTFSDDGRVVLLDVQDDEAPGATPSALDDTLEGKFLEFLSEVEGKLAELARGRVVILFAFKGDATLAQLLADGSLPLRSPNGVNAIGALELRRSRRFFTLSIRFEDDYGLQISSFDSSDFYLVSSNGSTRPVTFTDVNKPGNGISRSARYQIKGPGGTWDRADNGEYALVQRPRQVRDVSGNACPVGSPIRLIISIPKGVLPSGIKPQALTQQEPSVVLSGTAAMGTTVMPPPTSPPIRLASEREGGEELL